ncbi:MAG: 2-oxo-4-hydroxy-4-carboxy-5-ureidoimidazoline decarboxylase [Chloroflexota bacterium]
MKLSILNTNSKEDFLAVTGGPLEGELWLAERVLEKRPFTSVQTLIEAFRSVINNATIDEKIRLISSHPDLAPTVDTTLSETSQKEQASAGLATLSSEEYQEFQRLNHAYREKFNFPFVICARENNKHSILEQFALRLTHEREAEIEIGIQEIIKIIRLRLIDLIDISE